MTKIVMAVFALLLSVNPSNDITDNNYRVLRYQAKTGQFTLEHGNLKITAVCTGKRIGKDAQAFTGAESCFQLSKKVGEWVRLREGKVSISPITADLTYEIQDSLSVTTLPGTDHFAEEYLHIASKHVKK